MPVSDIFFCAIVSFLIGVFIASLGIKLLTTVLIAMLAATIFLIWGFIHRDKKFLVLAILALLILPGAAYYQLDFQNFQNIKIDFNKEINFKGWVIDDPNRGLGVQNLLIQLQEPNRGRITAKLRQYPEFQYGDFISFNGIIKKPSADYEQNYFLVKKINGSTNFPQALREKSGRGFALQTFLFKIKNSVIASYKKILSPEQAAFLTALMLGDTDQLSSSFKKTLNSSGVRHLAVFSGAHLSLIAVALFTVFGSIFSATGTFLLSGLTMFIFICVTGFRFSVARALIMGLIAALASVVGRIYDPRNALALCVFLFVLFNPQILVFDNGFHFSILAILGIIYLCPALKKFFRGEEKKSRKTQDNPEFFGWQEIFLMTLSVQLAIMPLLVSGSGGFPLLALIANFLLFSLIPLTMLLGFAIGFFSFFFGGLATILGWLISLFLDCEIAIINFFAKFALPLNFRFGFWAITIYYLLLIWFIRQNSGIRNEKV